MKISRKQDLIKLIALVYITSKSDQNKINKILFTIVGDLTKVPNGGCKITFLNHIFFLFNQTSLLFHLNILLQVKK